MDYNLRVTGSDIYFAIEGLVIVLVAATAFLSKFRHRMTTRASKNLLMPGGDRF